MTKLWAVCALVARFSLLSLVVAANGAGAAEPWHDPGKVMLPRIEGTNLIVIRPDGRRFEGAALIGAVVVGRDPERGGAAFRIDAVRADPEDTEVILYDLSARDTQSGEWKPYCVPDVRGVTAGIFLAGSWDSHGVHLHDDMFSVSCTSGVIGKCVRAGYKPWRTAPDGKPMWDYHQACTRLMRADYCGDGTAHTRNGTPIEIIDRLGSTEEPDTGFVFEAGWTPGGASCVAKPRLSPSPWSLEDIAAECPERLSGRVGDFASCNATTELARTEVLLINKSRE